MEPHSLRRGRRELRSVACAERCPYITGLPFTVSKILDGKLADTIQFRVGLLDDGAVERDLFVKTQF